MILIRFLATGTELVGNIVSADYELVLVKAS
jgi:hypothetical protein